MTALLDANVLIALVVTDHVHHERVDRWMRAQSEFSTCPITQGALVRFLIRSGVTTGEALQVLRGVSGDGRHRFWPDSIAFADVNMVGVVGHRRVTDAYLAQLARARAGTIATLDDALAALHADVAVVVPHR